MHDYVRNTRMLVWSYSHYIVAFSTYLIDVTSFSHFSRPKHNYVSKTQSSEVGNPVY